MTDTFRLDDIRGTARWSEVTQRIPMRRPSAGEDVPNMVLYLCSDQGAWITGQSINVDGGWVVNA
jgi:NAD(P)-dependent dehydrogenase (short-subunit alcohol dehydrogenase family)